MPAKDTNDRSPTFVASVDHLEAAGVIIGRMRSWADRIKDKGNDANHELQSYSIGEVTEVATFTHQLLRLAYQMDFLMAETAVDDKLQKN